MATSRHPALVAAAIAIGLCMAGHADAAPTIRSVGSVTRHAAKFTNHHVILRGYVIARRTGYILFSDEPRGRITRYDLPVVGAGLDNLKAQQRYVIEGRFLDHGLKASNANPDHLQLTTPPRRMTP